MATEICHAVHPVGFIGDGNEIGELMGDRNFDPFNDDVLIDVVNELGPLDGSLMFHSPLPLPVRLAWGGIHRNLVF